MLGRVAEMMETRGLAPLLAGNRESLCFSDGRCVSTHATNRELRTTRGVGANLILMDDTDRMRPQDVQTVVIPILAMGEARVLVFMKNLESDMPPPPPE